MERANQLQSLLRQQHIGLRVTRHTKECTDDPKEITEHLIVEY